MYNSINNISYLVNPRDGRGKKKNGEIKIKFYHSFKLENFTSKNVSFSIYIYLAKKIRLYVRSSICPTLRDFS